MRRVLLATMVASPAAAQPVEARPDSVGAAHAVHAFLVAFDSLRWTPFAEAWAPEASVFLPDADTPRQLIGRVAVLAYFSELFADVTAGATSGTPTLGILPSVRDLGVRLTGPGAALVTFELGSGAQPGRRTLILTWNEELGRWLLLHLHASRLTASGPRQLPREERVTDAPSRARST